MPKKVDIETFCIARSHVDQAEVERWLDFLGAGDFELPSGVDVSDPALVIALAAKRCYMSFEPGLNPNVVQVRRDYVEYFDNILSSGHGSVLEHATFTFAIENVSRVFTAEMNRHRAGWAISEGSLRFIRFDKDIPYWEPLSIQPSESDDEDLRLRKMRTCSVFDAVFRYVEDAYGELLRIWDMEEGAHNFDYKKKVTSCLRRIVPLGVATGGVWTGNVRALRHVFAMRCSAAAEEEICYVFSNICKQMSDLEPLLFGDFYQNDDGFWVPKYVKV